MSEKVYPKGLAAFAPKQGAPSFIIADVVISIDQLNDWINENRKHITTYQDQPQLRIQLLAGNRGPYFQVNTYQRGENPYQQAQDIADKQTDDMPF